MGLLGCVQPAVDENADLTQTTADTKKKKRKTGSKNDLEGEGWGWGGTGPFWETW